MRNFRAATSAQVNCIKYKDTFSDIKGLGGTRWLCFFYHSSRFTHVCKRQISVLKFSRYSDLERGPDFFSFKLRFFFFFLILDSSALKLLNCFFLFFVHAFGHYVICLPPSFLSQFFLSLHYNKNNRIFWFNILPGTLEKVENNKMGIRY